MPKQVILLATSRYSINMNDFLMFFRRSSHEIVAIFYEECVAEKPWWRDNLFIDAARDGCFDRMDFNTFRYEEWSDTEDLVRKINKYEFDYVCMGNGNAEAQKELTAYIGKNKCLFSEYGWLPWHQHFYISRDGCGTNSEITNWTEDDLKQIQPDYEAIETLKAHYRNGKSFRGADFIYVPLQKDVNDFKFLSSPFADNKEFLDFIHEVVPENIEIWVKCHPLYQKDYGLKKYGRFLDITHSQYCKHDLYKKMRAMICINSTSILEAILFDGKVFGYGEDIFLNKNIVQYRKMDRKSFESALDTETNHEIGKAFISLLMQRQVMRRRCIDNDFKYIREHYWNTQI